jgi:hypothetical protein
MASIISHDPSSNQCEMVQFLSIILFVLQTAKWVSHHHGMVCPQDADGGNDLQIWKVAANVLNKQSQKPTSGGTVAWGQLLAIRNNFVTKYYNGQVRLE